LYLVDANIPKFKSSSNLEQRTYRLLDDVARYLEA